MDANTCSENGDGDLDLRDFHSQEGDGIGEGMVQSVPKEDIQDVRETLGNLAVEQALDEWGTEQGEVSKTNNSPRYRTALCIFAEQALEAEEALKKGRDAEMLLNISSRLDRHFSSIVELSGLPTEHIAKAKKLLEIIQSTASAFAQALNQQPTHRNASGVAKESGSC